MPIQTSFNAGEFSELMGGDVDLDKRGYSVSTLSNMIALKQGPATRRGPTVYVGEVKDSSVKTALLNFESSDKRKYVIEVGDLYFRIYKPYERCGTVEIVTPYTQASLFDDKGKLKLKISQSADVLYIVHPDFSPRALSSVDDTTWSLATMLFNDGPYLDENSTTTTLTLSGTSGSVTVTASAALFASTDVGRLIRWKDPANNWTWLEITAYTSTTVVTALISGANASAGTATESWRLGVYSGTTGYPSTIAFFQDRVALFIDDRYDLTTIGGYSSTEFAFRPTNEAGTVADDNAITGQVPSGLVNSIEWAASNLRGLIVGTSKEEFIIRATSFGESITPTNTTAAVISGAGGSSIQPVRTMNGSIFVQDSLRKVFDVIYSFEQDSLQPQDLTLAAEHITRGLIVASSYQKEPANLVWFLKATGELLCLTHYPDQKVYGWHRHTIGGVSDADGSNAIVEAITSIPSDDGVRDDLWMIVNRYIDGGTKRYIEYLKQYCDDDVDITDSACCDSRFTYDSTETDTVTGLDHLEGETVKVMVDGKSHPDLVVTGGEVVLANSRVGSKIQIGLAYPWKLVTRDIEVRLANGDTAQGKVKRLVEFSLRLYRSLGFSYGKKDGTMYVYDFNQGQSYDEVNVLFSGDTEMLAWPDGSDRNVQMEFSGDGVFPITIVALMYKVSVQP